MKCYIAREANGLFIYRKNRPRLIDKDNCWNGSPWWKADKAKYSVIQIRKELFPEVNMNTCKEVELSSIDIEWII